MLRVYYPVVVNVQYCAQRPVCELTYKSEAGAVIKDDRTKAFGHHVLSFVRTVQLAQCSRPLES